jgi:hypothetical protein
MQTAHPFFARQDIDQPFDLTPLAKLRDIPAVAAFIGFDRRFLRRVKTETGHQGMRIINPARVRKIRQWHDETLRGARERTFQHSSIVPVFAGIARAWVTMVNIVSTRCQGGTDVPTRDGWRFIAGRGIPISWTIKPPSHNAPVASG